GARTGRPPARVAAHAAADSPHPSTPGEQRRVLRVTLWAGRRGQERRRHLQGALRGVNPTYSSGLGLVYTTGGWLVGEGPARDGGRVLSCGAWAGGSGSL